MHRLWNEIGRANDKRRKGDWYLELGNIGAELLSIEANAGEQKRRVVGHGDCKRAKQVGLSGTVNNNNNNNQ